MKLLLAIVIATFTSQLFAQCGGGCCGGGCQGGFCPMPMGSCQGGQCQGPPQYEEDSPQQLPPVGSPGTPQFRPNPPGQFQPLPSPPAIQTPPNTPPKPSIDWDAYDAQQKAIAEAQKKLTDQGEQSLVVLNDIKVAVTSQKGCQCQPTDLKPVLDAIADLKASAPAPAATPGVPAAEQHIVVVADHNAPYWQQLSSALADARKTYSGIQDTTLPPFDIGVTPQAVVYKNSVPVRTAKGQYAVLEMLSRASRGDPF